MRGSQLINKTRKTTIKKSHMAFGLVVCQWALNLENQVLAVFDSWFLDIAAAQQIRV